MNCKHCKKDIPEGATKCPECQSDLRNWFVRHKIISGILGLFILGLILSVFGTSDTRTTSVSGNNTPKEYQEVINLSTTSTKNSDSFNLAGGKQKLTYTIEKKPFGGCTIYLLDEGTDLLENGGFPVVFSAEESGETILRKGPGDYYLSVQAANTNCSVRLEEEQ
mgnify:CR=1 FL=1